MVSQTAKYALRILGYLVDHYPGQRIQGREIAAATGIPPNYLSKILNQMRKRGFVDSQKGWGGGFRLRERSLSIPLAEILDLFEGSRDESRTCVFDLRSCDSANPCPLHRHWERVQREYEGMLQELSIGDLRTGHKDR